MTYTIGSKSIIIASIPALSENQMGVLHYQPSLQRLIGLMAPNQMVRWPLVENISFMAQQYANYRLSNWIRRKAARLVPRGTFVPRRACCTIGGMSLAEKPPTCIGPYYPVSNKLTPA